MNPTPPHDGILFIDKDEGWTSHDAVAKTRRALGMRKVGHAGTLDPMATGLLTLGVGASTRLLTHLVGLGKTYRATIRLGESTVSDDRESDVTETAPEGRIDSVTEADILRGIEPLTGNIEQVPSKVSAIKVDGKRSYDRVRSGEVVELKARPVTIYAFDVHEIRRAIGVSGIPVIDVDGTVTCSSGTYIRALARDLGAALGVGGHLTALRRTAVGPFALPDHKTGPGETGSTGAAGVVSTEPLTTEQLASGEHEVTLVPPAQIARALFDVIELTEAQAVDLANGKKLEVDHPDQQLVAAIGPEERLVGLVSIKKGGTRVVTNFPVPAPVPKPEGAA